MGSIVQKAQHVVDVESGKSTVEIHLNNKEKDVFETKPKGDWTKVKFTRYDLVTESDFLRAMVRPTLDIYRKIASLEANRALDGVDIYWRIKVMKCIRILDPSFGCPYINLKCKWQVNLLYYLTEKVLFSIIETCKNPYKLKRFSDVMRTLQ